VFSAVYFGRTRILADCGVLLSHSAFPRVSTRTSIKEDTRKIDFYLKVIDDCKEFILCSTISLCLPDQNSRYLFWWYLVVIGTNSPQVDDEGGFIRFYKALPEKEDDTIRVFERSDFYTAHGDDASFIARTVSLQNKT